MGKNVAEVMYTTAPASYDGLPATPVACPYRTSAGAQLRKIIVPGADFVSQMNVYLKAKETVTFPETQLEKYLETGFVVDREVSVAAREVMKRNDEASNNAAQETAMAHDDTTDNAESTTANTPRSPNVRTVKKRGNATIIVDAPANVTPQVAALDGMTPLGVPANDAPAALDTPAEVAAATPKRKRTARKTDLDAANQRVAGVTPTVGLDSMPQAAEQVPAPAPAPLATEPEPEPEATPEPDSAPAPEPEAAPARDAALPVLTGGQVESIKALRVPFVTDNPGEQVAYIKAVQEIGGDAALVYAITYLKSLRVGTVVQPGKAKRAQTASPIRQSSMSADTVSRETADAIRAAHAKGDMTQKQLAEHFGVTRLFAWECLNHVRFTDTPNPKYAYSRTGK